MLRLAAYFKEREDFDCIVTDEGFASYKIMGEECYIRDLWVERDYRKSGLASQMADDISRIALSKGCKFLSGSISLTANNPTESAAVLIAYGFKVHSANQLGVFFRKDL